MANNKLKNRKTVWCPDFGETPEIEYLCQHNQFFIDLKNDEKRYRVVVKGVEKYYPKTSRILFHNIVMDTDGKVRSLQFMFVEHPEVTLWTGDKGIIPEIEYMIKNYALVIDPDNVNAMYRFTVDDQMQCYPEDTMFEFFHYIKELYGNILSVDFNVLVKQERIVMPNECSTPEIQYLMKRNGLVIDPDDFDNMYRVKTTKGWRSYPNGARVRFWNYRFDEHGEILSVNFKFEQLKWV